MSIKKYNEFVNENSILDDEYRDRQKSQLNDADYKLLQRAKFKKGDAVDWEAGDYAFYTIDYPFVDNGAILYNLRNPEGISSGGRVREYELSFFNDSEVNESNKDRRIKTKCGKEIYAWYKNGKYEIGVNGTSRHIGDISEDDIDDEISKLKTEFEKNCD